MLTNPQPPQIHLPKGWQDCVQSAVLHSIALGPPVFYLLNLSLVLRSVFLFETDIYFLIYPFVMSQYGVPRGTPPYPPVTHDVSRNILIKNFNEIRSQVM